MLHTRRNTVLLCVLLLGACSDPSGVSSGGADPRWPCIHSFTRGTRRHTAAR